MSKVNAVRSQVIRKVLSLSFVMPNGKPLGECTFGYLAEVGGIFGKISEKGNPNQIVRDVLSAAQLAAIAAS